MSVGQFRDIVLALPEAVESQHHGHPDFRVRTKIFATLWPDQRRGVLMLPLLEHAAALQRDPDAYRSLGKPSLRGVTGVMLDHADPEDVWDLALEAWCSKAPPKLVQEFLDAERHGRS